MVNQKEKICQAYLRKVPIAHALPRVIECFALRQFDLKPPILDLGCGDGVFAWICLGGGRVDVGLDSDSRVVRLAGKSGAYKKVVLAKAGKMLFKDGSFNTVISNSVLEHIEDLNPVFKEVHRVLRGGGRFIFLVPDKTASDHFFYASFLEKIKLRSPANSYVRLKNRLYGYAHLEARDFWEKTARRNGFKIKRVTGLIAPKTVRIIDLLSPLALPDYLSRRFLKRSFVLRPDFLNRIISVHILKKTGPVKISEATAWYFELEKA